MKLVGDKATDALTIVHKLTAVAWVVATIGILVPITSSVGFLEPFAPKKVTAFEIAAIAAAITTVAVGVVYGVWTTYGFVRNSWVGAKWALTLSAALAGAAVIRGGISAGMALACTVAQLVAFACAIAIGVFLERRRHGRMASADQAGPS